MKKPDNRHWNPPSTSPDYLEKLEEEFMEAITNYIAEINIVETLLDFTINMLLALAIFLVGKWLTTRLQGVL